MTLYACQVINHSETPVFNVSMSFELTFIEAVQNKDGSFNGGQITLARAHPILADRIDKSDGSFTFYVYNSTPQFVQATLPKSAVFEIPGTQESRTTRLIHPGNIMLFPPKAG